MSSEVTSPASQARLLRTMGRLRWVLVVLSATLCAFSWWSFAHADTTSAGAPRFHCPMHPQIKSHDPGECPICHMTLEPIPEQRKKPPAKPRPATPSAGSAAGLPALPPGLPETLELDLARVQAINVRTREARALPGSGNLSVPAVVEAQERGRAEVHVRSAGFVESISVREQGARVKAGQPLLSLYSPEVFQAESELVALSKLGAGSEANLAGAKRRLELLGVPAAVSESVLRSGSANRTIAISAPIAGYVARVSAVLGAFVNPDAVLYEIVDPSRVYVVGSVPQSRAAEVTVGQAARFVPGDGAALALPGKIDLIYPELDRSARSMKARLSLDNPEGRILPGQFGRLELSLPAEAAVAVPRDAVIDTGHGAYAFIDEGEGRFRVVAVELGAVLPDDELEIQRGVTAGQRVVSGAAFLLDAESRLRAALAPSP